VLLAELKKTSWIDTIQFSLFWEWGKEGGK
jgi:hypothetical protein